MSSAPLSLFGYQEVGAQTIACYNKFGLHDDMGVGKTAQAIRGLELIGAKRAIIIAPAFLRSNWIKEFALFAREHHRIVKGVTNHDFVAWYKGHFQYLITSYEMATKWASTVWEKGEFIDAVILDEGHFLKTETTNRTRAILGPEADGRGGIINWSGHVWHLTGTPMSNDPIDAYTFLKMTGATKMTSGTFAKTYFHVRQTAYGTRQSPRPETTDELKGMLQAYSIRRTKKEAGLELPDIFLTQLEVDGDTTEVRKMMKETEGLENAIRKAIEEGGLSHLWHEHMSTLRRLVGEAKAVPYSHILEQEIRDYGEKRVVFGIHRDAMAFVWAHMNRKGYKTVMIRGGMKEAERDEAVTQFQNDPETMVAFCSIQAAGVGLTLTASCELDLFETDWTPGANAQALMRVHRIGQQRKVRGRFITLAKSIDVWVNSSVADKVADIAQIHGAPMLDMA